MRELDVFAGCLTIIIAGAALVGFLVWRGWL